MTLGLPYYDFILGILVIYVGDTVMACPGWWLEGV